MDISAAHNCFLVGMQVGQGVTCRHGFAATSRTRCPLHGLAAPVVACVAVTSCRWKQRGQGRRFAGAKRKSAPSNVTSDAVSGSGSEKGKPSRWAEVVLSDSDYQQERKGRAAEDKLLVARRKGLSFLELFSGLALGPLAALSYPWLEEVATDITSGSIELCVPFFGFKGCGTGAVPQALQGTFKSTVSLLFSFLLGYTFYSLFARQEQLTRAMYAEVASLTQLLEEAQLYLPTEMCLDMTRILKRYVVQGFWRNPTFLPAELMARNLRSDNDSLEQMSRLLVENSSEIDPGPMLQTVSDLRAKQADTYAALQTTVPFAQLILLSFLGILCTLPPFFDGQSEITGGSQLVYGLLVEVIAIVLLVVQDAANPITGFYSVEMLRGTLLSAILEAFDRVETKLKAQIAESRADSDSE